MKPKTLQLKNLLDWSPEIVKIKKQKVLNKNVDATINHNEYKDVLLSNKCIRYSVNRIQRKDHTTGTYEINKI